jgi:hypothetical protein
MAIAFRLAEKSRTVAMAPAKMSLAHRHRCAHALAINLISISATPLSRSICLIQVAAEHLMT